MIDEVEKVIEKYPLLIEAYLVKAEGLIEIGKKNPNND